ncbi:hypothetical protein GOODEAATRI_025588 [Goodea atripinnis]|uniref:Uncharacterized protein n=1 Tax=Goodea atripinnis TaxID=208336 RepID=A0ABV0Q114_9TELE
MSETTFTNMGLDDGTDRSFSSSAECIKLQEFLAACRATAPHNSISAMAVGKLIGVLVLLQCSAGEKQYHFMLNNLYRIFIYFSKCFFITSETDQILQLFFLYLY